VKEGTSRREDFYFPARPPKRNERRIGVPFEPVVGSACEESINLVSLRDRFPFETGRYEAELSGLGSLTMGRV